MVIQHGGMYIIMTQKRNDGRAFRVIVFTALLVLLVLLLLLLPSRLSSCD
jgi:4-amino-4-deoxy-L-arabinose transferase-like glycosyltransferase